MRDPLRIPTILLELMVFWSKHPDLRLGQILCAGTAGDPFYLEDDTFVEWLKEQV